MARHVYGRDPVPVWAAASMLAFAVAALLASLLPWPLEAWVCWPLQAAGVGCLAWMCVLVWRERRARRLRRGRWTSRSGGAR